jgi:hypothetical protein
VKQCMHTKCTTRRYVHLYSSPNAFHRLVTACSCMLPAPSACLPSPSPSPSPSPAPVPAQLALISKVPPGFPTGGNLTATQLAPGTDTCVKQPSPVEGSGANVTNPGAGQCGSGVNPGNYGLTQVPPAGLVFDKWVCYNTSSGAVLPTTPSSQALAAGQAVTCVAEYEEAPSPSPSPSVPPSR